MESFSAVRTQLLLHFSSQRDVCPWLLRLGISSHWAYTTMRIVLLQLLSISLKKDTQAVPVPCRSQGPQANKHSRLFVRTASAAG